jgi:hypothetical protein
MRRWIVGLLAALGGLRATPADAQEVVEYYHLDAVGSVRAVTDGHGQVVRRHDYFPFGEEYLATGSLDRLRFTGRRGTSRRGWTISAPATTRARSGGSRPWTRCSTSSTRGSTRSGGTGMRTR